MAKPRSTDKEVSVTEVTPVSPPSSPTLPAVAPIKADRKNGDTGGSTAAQQIIGGQKQVRKTKRRSKKAKANSVNAASESDSEKKRVQRPYPTKTLDEAIALPQKIKEKNHGNPWRT